MPSDPDRAAAPVVGVREDLDELTGPFHRHARAQLVFCAEGVVSVTTARGLFVVPPQRAVWVPGGERHKVDGRRPFRLRTLYFDEARAADLPTATAVLSVSPLLRELVLAAVGLPWAWPAKGREARLVTVLIDELRQVPVAPLVLPRGRDPRLLRACAAIEREPGEPHDLEALARVAGTSSRQLARLFLRDTGLTPAAWRAQLRLLRALERLGAGEPILQVALELGYGSSSSFGVMFKRALGTTPGRYFEV